MTDSDKPLSVYGLKFRLMLQLIPHPDGGYWTGTKMRDATNNVVGPSYFTNLRTGIIDIPRADKIEAIAHAMDFPVELWFKDLSWWESLHARWQNGEFIGAELQPRSGTTDNQTRMTTLVNQLFEDRPNKQTGEPFTEEEVAQRSGGDLSVSDVAALRSGELTDPTWVQLLALSNVFGVGLSYFSGSDAPLLPSGLDALQVNDDYESYITFRNSVGMDKQQRSLLRSMSEHLRRQSPRAESDTVPDEDVG